MPKYNTVPLNMVPKRGLKFIHHAWMDENHNPQKYVITRIARGAIYYTPADGRFPFYVSLEDFSKYVKDGKLFEE